jgi:CBS domain-containing protein
MRVRDLMTKEVATISEDDSLKEAARIMTEKRVSGLPVVDSEGIVIGMLSEADFVERAGNERAGLVAMLFDRNVRRLKAEVVGQAMTKNVITVDGDAPYTLAARLMDRKRVKRLPVVDGAGRLLGIVSRSDVLGVFARPDEAIADHIRQRIINETLDLEPDSVTVAVEEGQVSLMGEVPTRMEARLLEDLSKAVDGVLAVDSQVRYRHDDTRTSEGRTRGAPRPNW